ncbi:MAG: NAD(P)-dependent oxidoreductase [Sphingomonadales bacterium]|nr:NAD(P)-dependent oxidoreductase [Sphingomonadales bacterium]MBU3992663.1 NAD(P)-dependent oxidoreductase [Alphaproteobacteria bacterium]
MLQGQKILVTGVGGTVAFPLAKFLATANEVWGAARFSAEGAREKVAGAGITPVPIDLETGDLGALPDDFDYVLHLAYFRGGEDSFDRSVRVNAEGCGLVLQHCRKAKAALVTSAAGIYSPRTDPLEPAREESPTGGSFTPWALTAGSAKVAQEAVARFAARAFDLPVTIARLNTVYGPDPRMLPTTHMGAVMAGRDIVAVNDPYPHTPIHIDDMCDQLAAMLGAASVPATIVNWGGDEVVSVQQWCAMAAEWSGRPAQVQVRHVSGASIGNISDTTRRRQITGPCRISFAEGYRAIFDMQPTGGG